MEFTLKINYVEKIKEYDGMEQIIHAVNWTYMCLDKTSEHTLFRTIHGTTSLDLPNKESFKTIDKIDYFVLKSWLESVLDLNAMQEKLKFLLTVTPLFHNATIIEGTNALNQI
jgi:hypothetical protein